MTQREILDILHTVFDFLELDLQILEYEKELLEEDESGQCNKGTPEDSGD